MLPGLACPPESFDAVRAGLRTRGADLVLDVRDAWTEPLLAADVDEVLGSAAYDGVIGHSLGGLLAVEIALRRPDRVGRLVLLDPTPPREQGPPAVVRALLRRPVRVLLRAAEALGVLAMVDRLVTRRWRRLDVARTGLLRDRRTWSRLLAEVEVGWDRARRVDAALTGAGLRCRTDLAVPVPVTAAARRSQRRLAARLGATLHPVVGTGHLVMCDRADAVVDLVIARPAGGAEG